jgi:excisionase family DNA binding protein
MATLSPWLGTSEAARELGVSANRVRQFIADGRLACLATPYGRLLDAQEVRQFAAARAAAQVATPTHGGDDDPPAPQTAA